MKKLISVADAANVEFCKQKQNLINGIKNYIAENGNFVRVDKTLITNKNTEYNLSKMYLDPINNSLYFELGSGERVKVLNDFDSPVEEGKGCEAIMVSTDNLFAIIQTLESYENDRTEAASSVSELITRYGISSEELKNDFMKKGMKW